MRSIGGEFEISPSLLRKKEREGPPLPASGRAALFQVLRHIASSRGEGSVALPDYVCGSVIDAVVAAGFAPRFYHVGDDLHPEHGSLRAALEAAPTAAVFVSYFGLVDLSDDLTFARQAGAATLLIKDDVHTPADVEHLQGADYAFTSFRKALPVPDGASITPRFALDLDTGGASLSAVAKLAGSLTKYARRFESVDDEAFLSLFEQGEALLSGAGAYRAAMSWMSVSLLEAADRGAFAAQRRRNFLDLEAAIGPIGLRPIVPLAGESVPLFLPVRLKNRDMVRRALARQKIFCPVHWPMPIGHDAILAASHLYEGELSLVIDQRYDASDMRRIADALASCGAS